MTEIKKRSEVSEEYLNKLVLSFKDDSGCEDTIIGDTLAALVRGSEAYLAGHPNSKDYEVTLTIYSFMGCQDDEVAVTEAPGNINLGYVPKILQAIALETTGETRQKLNEQLKDLIPNLGIIGMSVTFMLSDGAVSSALYFGNRMFTEVKAEEFLLATEDTTKVCRKHFYDQELLHDQENKIILA